MKEEYNKLINSKEFKDWKSKNKDSFLCSYVYIDESQFDFYNKNHTLTSFIVTDNIEIKDNEEMLKSKSKLKELNLSEIKVNKDEALDLIEDKKEYTKTIAILQNTEHPFWNITLIGPTKILNIKINAIDKKILSKEVMPISKLMKKVY